MGIKQNLVGQTFNRLHVVSIHHRNERGRAFYFCLCVCGKEKIIDGRSLKSGVTKSCGCLNVEKISRVNFKHGQSNKSPEYAAWKNARNRCNNPHSPDYPGWGGRGIKMCSGWGNFESFLIDLGKKPSKIYSINRINNDGMYSCGKCPECLTNGWPLNCRWDIPKTQANNRRKDTSAYSRAAKKKWRDLSPQERANWCKRISEGCLAQ